MSLDEPDPLRADLERLNAQPCNNNLLPVGRSEVDEIERSYSGVLPLDYRHFLQNFGCTIFPGSPVMRDSPDNGVELLMLFGADASGLGKSVLWNQRNSSDHCTPREMPIGDDLFGNKFILNIDTGDVAFIDVDAGHTLPVATSFSDLLAKLEPRQQE